MTPTQWLPSHEAEARPSSWHPEFPQVSGESEKGYSERINFHDEAVCGGGWWQCVSNTCKPQGYMAS